MSSVLHTMRRTLVGLLGLCLLFTALIPLAVSVSAEDAGSYSFSIAETKGVSVNADGTYKTSWSNSLATIGFYNAYADYLQNFRYYLSENANVYNSYNYESNNYTPWPLDTWSLTGSNNVGGFGYAHMNRFFLRYVPAGAPTARNMDMITSVSPDKKMSNKIKNFETTFAVRLVKDKVGGAVFGFRQQIVGKFAESAEHLNREQAFVTITRNGVTVAGGADIRDSYYADDEWAYDTALPEATTVVKITVRAVEHDVYVKVTDDAGAVTYFERTLYMDYISAGYLAYGISGPNESHGLGEIILYHLDENGNTVPLTAETAGETVSTTFPVTDIPGIPYSGGYDAWEKTPWLPVYASWAYDCNNQFRRHVVKYFGMYDDNAGAVNMLNDSTGINTPELNGGYSCFGVLYANQWMRRHVVTKSQSTFNRISSLVVRRVGTTENDVFRNVETKFSMNFNDNQTVGGVIVGMRQRTAGKFTDSADALNKEQTFVSITREGVTVAGGADILDSYYTEQEHPYDTGLPAGNITLKVTVRALNDTVYVRITSNDGKTVYFEKTETVDYAYAGYLAFGVSGTQDEQIGLGNITWKRLAYDGSSAGNVQTAEEKAFRDGMRIAAKKTKDGKVRVVSSDAATGTATVAVLPDAGFETKAGTLCATKGNELSLPQRKGFRTDGNATLYTVSAEVPVTVTAEFFAPTAENANIGNIGTSVNAEKYGLRFVSRLNRTVTDGVEYITLDGQKVAVKDYGMLIAAESVIGNGVLTDELAAENSRVKKLSVVERQIYFDYCDDYVDMSACITNIDKVEGGLSMKLVARPYVITENDTILYADMVNSTYERAAGMKSVSFAALTAAG